jgi:hypothetical protein
VRYQELFEKVTGEAFTPAKENSPVDRIEQNIMKGLQKLNASSAQRSYL